MPRRPKDIGTAAETAVVRTARIRGFPGADRLTLTGANDRGDIGLCPGVILEVKGGEAARSASDGMVAKWLDETERERANAGADIALLVVQRRGVGAPNAHRWWAWWRLGWLEQLRANEPRCRVCGCTDTRACIDGCAWRSDDGHGPCCTSCDPASTEHLIPVRLHLADALRLLHAAGYGGIPERHADMENPPTADLGFAHLSSASGSGYGDETDDEAVSEGDRSNTGEVLRIPAPASPTRRAPARTICNLTEASPTLRTSTNEASAP